MPEKKNWKQRRMDELSNDLMIPERLKACRRGILSLRAKYPNCPQVLMLECNLCCREERYEEAFDICTRAHKLAPSWGFPLGCGVEICNILGRFDESMRIIQHFWGWPLTTMERIAALYIWSETEARRGRWPESWELARRICLMEDAPKADPATLWNGEALDGKTILVYGSGQFFGWGDQFHLSRYLLFLRERGAARIVLGRGHKGMFSLLERSGLCDEIREKGEACPPHDYWCHLGSLPYLLRERTGPQVPTPPAYLFACPLKRAYWGKRLQELAGNSLRVGIVWCGDPGNGSDALRSAPLAAFASLAAVPGVTLFSLQKGPKENEAAPDGLNLIRLSDDIHDYDDTAAIIVNLDLVITVDTSVCHLVGALGVPVWTLLAQRGEWRWAWHPEKTLWYPSMRLWRQSGFQDWTELLERVAEGLRHYTQQHFPMDSNAPLVESVPDLMKT